MKKNNIRFKNKYDFSLYIEMLKQEHEFDTYIETVSFFYENESDSEMVDITKMLNKKIMDNINDEAQFLNLVKDKQIGTTKLF